MTAIRARLGLTIFVGFVVTSVLLWFYLARHMPLRYFTWFCLLTAAYVALGLVVFRSFADRIKQSRAFGLLVELLLGVVFIAAYYWFAVYVYPGDR
jgi:hypothetical protein